MTFFRTLHRRGLRVLAPLAAAAALLTACGGGTSQVQAFVPARLLVVGDETGMIVDDGDHDGYKYSLNDRVTAITATTAHCQLLPTPAQQLAAYYGFVFGACNPPATDGTRPEPKAFTLAQPAARTDDTSNGLKAQIDAVTALGSTDMVMVSMGTNDIIALYEQRRAGTWTSDNLVIAEARRRGNAAADQVERVLATGARALVVTVPVLGLSPYAIAAEATSPGAAALITRLTSEFNAGLMGIDSTRFDGRNWGLVLADNDTGLMQRFPTSYLNSPANTTDARCATDTLPQGCLIVVDSDGVAPDNSVAPRTHLWATDRFVGPRANELIGAQVLSRAANNPF